MSVCLLRGEIVMLFCARRRILEIKRSGFSERNSLSLFAPAHLVVLLLQFISSFFRLFCYLTLVFCAKQSEFCRMNEEETRES